MECAGGVERKLELALNASFPRVHHMSLQQKLLICITALLLSPSRLAAQTATAVKPIPVKVVVVTMFERGEDTGDMPGEFQLWVEREHLDQIFPATAGYHHVRM